VKPSSGDRARAATAPAKRETTEVLSRICNRIGRAQGTRGISRANVHRLYALFFRDEYRPARGSDPHQTNFFPGNAAEIHFDESGEARLTEGIDENL
jgi:hypothetical protein